MFKVLIVDDDPMVSDINRHYVEKNTQFTVLGICSNGQTALDFLNWNKIDLVVLDVFMPVMDGVETLKNIRNKKIPCEVIMVTAANDTQTIENTMNLGVLDYLVKPFSLERLQISLEKFIAKKSILTHNTILDQQKIDSLITKNVPPKNEELPKGIQKKTLEIITQYFENNSTWQSVELIAEKLEI